MAHWDGKQIVGFKPERYPGHRGWQRVDCGCCNGLEWGGEEPRECRRCGGDGSLAFHRKSGTYAMYPGGPLAGREPKLKGSQK